MNDIIELNNKAIRCFQEGNSFEACNYLTDASGVCLCATESSAKKRKRVVHRDYIISWVNLASHCKETKKDPDNFHPSTYQHAPAIRKPCCESTYGANKTCKMCRDDSNVCPCSIAPVIWYNLALSCQILGSELDGSTRDGAFYLNRSIFLYEKVLSTCCHERSNQSGGLSNLRIAVLNNLACVHHEIGKLDECLATMQLLRRSLHVATRKNPRRMLRNWRIFHVNLMMMNSDRPAAAA